MRALLLILAPALFAAHWAFGPVRAADPPRVRDESWVRNPIDRFILAKLEQEGIEPSPEAGKLTLARHGRIDDAN
ncbi:MAG: hypothetical protein FJW39_15530 [Acidobacteria bacterium]|nr:hypothetical protein [Acidobacteriota bacterium]